LQASLDCVKDDMDVIVGFDPAVRGDAGWAVLTTDGDYVDSGIFTFDAKESLDERLRILYWACVSVLIDHDQSVIALAVEIPPGKVSHRPQRADIPLILGQAVGVIRAAAYRRFLPVVTIYPSQIRAAAGHGHMTKEQVQQAMRERFSLSEELGPDEAMALAVCLAALKKLDEQKE